MTTRTISTTQAAQHERIQATLEALRLTAGVLIDEALMRADIPAFEVDGEDEFHRPPNPTRDVLDRLRSEVVDLCHKAKSAIHDGVHGVDRTPDPHGEYGA